MELLSFLYLLIDLSCLGLLIYGSIAHWYLILVAISIYLFHPIITESILKLLYSILYSIRPLKSTLESERLHQPQIVYNPIYDIRIFGIEAKHSFDAVKFSRTLGFLLELGPFAYTDSGDPDYAFLYRHISLLHLVLLNYSLYLSRIAEVNVWFLPGSLLRLFALRRFVYSTQGSITASLIAIERGFAVNLGGGYHHADTNRGSGFCFYNDIGLVCQYLWKYRSSQVRNIMIVDLDAHQGNGHERDKLLFGNGRMFIIDAYNQSIFPRDKLAKTAIDETILVTDKMTDNQYLNRVSAALSSSLLKFKPDLIIYNAGTDILEGDLLGQLNISEQGVIKRDELVARFGQKNQIPVLMVLSGGYQKSNAKVIAESLANILGKTNRSSREKETYQD